MKYLKITLIIVLPLVGLFLLAAVLVPRIYKNALLETIKNEANSNLTATLDFEDLDLSLFRQFPLLSVRLHNFSITGQEPFENETLIKSQTVEIAISIFDLFKKDIPLNIRRFHLHSPELNVIILQNGRANYDITIPDTIEAKKPEEPTAFAFSLKDYSIRNGQIRYEDKSNATLAQMTGLNHRGKGDFTASNFDLDTKTTIDQFSLQYGGITYFTDAHVIFDIILGIDVDNSIFKIKNNKLKINELSLLSEGTIHLQEESMNIDFKVNAPTNDLKEFWSIIPGAYTTDYAALKTQGTFSFAFEAKGNYSDQSIPSFSLTTTIKDGSVKYPELPGDIKDIHLDLKANQPSTTLDALELDIPRFAFVIGSYPISGHLRAQDVTTDPLIDLGLKGTIDMAAIQSAYPTDAESLAGQIIADVLLKARMSALDESRYDDVQMSGNLVMQKVRYKAKDSPMIMIDEGKMTFSPQFVSIDKMDIQAGKSDMTLDGRIDNILAFIHPERTWKGDIGLNSNLIDLREWSSSDSEKAHSSIDTDHPDDQTLGQAPFDMVLKAKIGQLIQEDNTISNLVIDGKAGQKYMKINQLSGNTTQSDFAVTGYLENLMTWMTGTGVLGGVIHFTSKNLNLNEWMGEDDNTNESSEQEGVILVPADVQLKATAKIDNLQYTDLLLKNVNGTLAIGDQTILLDEFQCNAFGGKVLLQGAYNSKDRAKPEFNFKYDLQQIDFQQFFNKVNTFASIAPVGKYITGKFSSNLVMSGAFDEKMSPNLSSLDAAGFLETFGAIIQGFKPLDGLADKLNISELKKLDLKGTKNWFEINNGTLTLKDVDYKFKDINMVIGGTHSLTSDMNYTVKAKIPRKYLDKTGITVSANTGLKWIESEASSRGISFSLGEYVNLAVIIGGNLSNPTYSLRILGTEGSNGATTLEDQLKGQAEAAVDKVRDSIEHLAKKKIDEAKDELTKKAQQQIDTLKKQAEAQADSLLKKAKEEATKKIGDEATKKIEEMGGDKAKEEAEKLKEKMKKWNPLGGKKE